MLGLYAVYVLGESIGRAIANHFLRLVLTLFGTVLASFLQSFLHSFLLYTVDVFRREYGRTWLDPSDAEEGSRCLAVEERG